MTEPFIRSGATPPLVRVNARPWILFGLTLIFGILGLLGVWAATASISGAVIGQGVLTFSGKRKTVQHLEGGIVQRLLVRDGDKVEAGQLLVELDPTRARANLAIIESSLGKEMANEARLVAERDGAETVTYPPELLASPDPVQTAALIKTQNAIFQANAAALRGETDILRQRIAQFGEESNGLEAQRVSKGEQLRFIAEELKGLRYLLENGQTTKTRVLALERATAALRGDEGQLTAAIARAKQSVAENQLQILQRDKDFRKSVVEELQRTQAQLRDLRERQVAARDVLDRIIVIAPVAGTVLNLSVHTVGAVIKSGEAILEIVPSEKNVIEVVVRPQDIDNVISGQPAVLRFLAFKQRTAPVLNGVVTYVSADSLESRGGRQESYYLAHVEVTDSEFHRLGPLKLRPGMQAEVMIKTGKRTALHYIAQPIIDSMNRAMREE